ncbi:MAG: ribbon-helix-helix domain-containing protein [Deltaproteobacteria bacterium]|nr:ribbon-helix-helix domain-containing protein [Deltaproteobacteria bacterium]
MERRTTVVLQRDEDEALRSASKAAGISQSELIRRGIALVTAPYRRHRAPRTGWLRLTRREIDALMGDELGDRDA